MASLVAAGLSPLPGLPAAPPAQAAEPAAGGGSELDSARAEARRTGKRVEVVGRRSETKTVFAEPNGRVTDEVSTTPVRVRRGDGWAAVDPSLQLSDGVWKAKASAAEVTLSPGGTSVPLVTG